MKIFREDIFSRFSYILRMNARYIPIGRQGEDEITKRNKYAGEFRKQNIASPGCPMHLLPRAEAPFPLHQNQSTCLLVQPTYMYRWILLLTNYSIAHQLIVGSSLSTYMCTFCSRQIIAGPACSSSESNRQGQQYMLGVSYMAAPNCFY